MGKGRVRFKNLEDLALDVVGRTVARVSAEEHMVGLLNRVASIPRLIRNSQPPAVKFAPRTVDYRGGEGASGQEVRGEEGLTPFELREHVKPWPRVVDVCSASEILAQ